MVSPEFTSNQFFPDAIKLCLTANMITKIAVDLDKLFQERMVALLHVMTRISHRLPYPDNTDLLPKAGGWESLVVTENDSCSTFTFILECFICSVRSRRC